MKRLSVLFMIIVMFFIGCATNGNVSIDPESQEVIAKIAGRHVGLELAERYPDIAAEVKIVCQEIIAADDPALVNIAVGRLINVLATEIDDPLLAADIVDLLALIKIDIEIEITSEQMGIIKAATAGLISGIKLVEVK